jgi:Arylsulfatase A and related enzymes
MGFHRIYGTHSPDPVKFPLFLNDLLWLCLALAGFAHAAEAQRPNFIFVITDDISPDDLGPYGNKVVKTPNLDRLAQRALVFDQACNVTASCSPSRCAIITGRYPHNTGAPELHTTLPVDQKTFIQALRDAGYHTVLSGKNHMGNPAGLGFDEVSNSKPSGAENWVRHLRDRPRDQPFFCWFASHDAHHPFEFDENAPRYSPDAVEVPPMLYDGPLTREELAKFYHEVSRTDFYVGELLKELEAQGISDDTYFIYCSDNGRPFPRCKTYLYDSGIRTPLIIAGPGVRAGRTQSLVSSIDYAPTILQLAGVDIPETVQGVSFEPILGDPEKTVRDVAFAERNWHVFSLHERMVRTRDWLYIWNAWPDQHNVCGESAFFDFPAARELWEMADAGKLTDAQKQLTLPHQPAEMLFRISEDPDQLVNVASDPRWSSILGEMRSLLNIWKQETRDSVPENPTPSRDALHGGARTSGTLERSELPGSAAGATGINQPGPVRWTTQRSSAFAPGETRMPVSREE